MKNIELLNCCYKFFNEYITADELINKIELIDTSNLSKEDINKQNNLVEEIKSFIKNTEDDSYERWFSITSCISKNDYFNNIYDSLTDYELLEFIAQNIKAPFPPKISQEKFEKLVKAGKEKDKREWLWRLAFNYVDMDINFDSIADYYIEKKDGYYLSELINAVGENLNIDSIIDNVNDKDLLKDLVSRKDVIDLFVSEEQINKLLSKLDY